MTLAHVSIGASLVWLALGFGCLLEWGRAARGETPNAAR